MNKEQFVNLLKELNIALNDNQLEQLEQYYQFLESENKLYNLTSITAKDQVYLKHFYDSLTITKAVKLTNQEIIDLGTGAGFPGIVLKICFPEIRLTLLDSTRKKCIFLEKLSKKLNLKNTTVINDRAENYSKTTREKYDLVVSRAVAPLKHLLEYGIPLLKVHGKFISMKSNIEKEITDIEEYIKKLELINLEVINFNLPIENSNRNLVIFEKNKKTKDIYPRKYTEIKKGKI